MRREGYGEEEEEEESFKESQLEPREAKREKECRNGEEK